MAAADRLISRRLPLVVGMLSDLGKGAAAAEQMRQKFWHLGQNSFRFVFMLCLSCAFSSDEHMR
jgi:hypothetical protein